MTPVMVWRSYTDGRGPPLKVVTALFASVYTLSMKRFQFWTKKTNKTKMRHKDTFATISDTPASTRQFILKKKVLGYCCLFFISCSTRPGQICTLNLKWQMMDTAANYWWLLLSTRRESLNPSTQQLQMMAGLPQTQVWVGCAFE